VNAGRAVWTADQIVWRDPPAVESTDPADHADATSAEIEEFFTALRAAPQRWALWPFSGGYAASRALIMLGGLQVVTDRVGSAVFIYVRVP
jgi:hypothetical protein